MHERASPYLSAVFGPGWSFWKRESLRRGSDQYILGDTTKSRGCAMVRKPSGTEYEDVKIRRIDHRRASGAAASVARREVIGFIFLVGACVTSLWAEYNLAVRFAIMVSVVSVSGLLALLGALLRAPEGYENENGFHIRARRKEARRPRHVLAISGSRS